MSKSKNLTLNEVKHIGKLVSLDLQEEEIRLFASQLTKTLDYIDNLNKINTEQIEPTFQTTGNTNRFLEENLGERTFSQAVAVKNASSSKNGLFTIKGLNYQK